MTAKERRKRDVRVVIFKDYAWGTVGTLMVFYILYRLAILVY